jgi:LPS-assembly protein
MKNKILVIFLTLVFNLSFSNFAVAVEFTFEVTDIDILENNTVYKGNNRGKVITDTQVELISDNFLYLKKVNRLEAFGDVQLTDLKSNVIINAEEMIYLKSDEIIYTSGKTLINVDGKYNIEGHDMILLKNEMILSSNKKATITDNISNIYKLDKFQYSINQEMLKGEKVTHINSKTSLEKDEYYFETGFFDLKESKFLGKNVNIKFHKTLYNNKLNDPRILAASSYGNEYNSYLEKAIFTSCKKTDKCPPWKMRAEKMRHDKIKKRIIYENAWLEIYDFPVAYFPKFFHPGPSVNRQSGFLSPEIGDHSTLGDSIYLPYYYVLSDSTDMTLKPRLFNDNKVLLQAEYRQETKNSLTVIDSSITTGHYSDKKNKGDKDTRSHLFTDTYIDLDIEGFTNSNLQINYQKISNDTYLKLFDFILSPLWTKSRDTISSNIALVLDNDDYAFDTSIRRDEHLSGLNSDRYTYTLPQYNFSKNFILNNLTGSFNFNTSGNHTISSTNISNTSISNNLNYTSGNNYTDFGIKKNYSFQLKNSNTMSDNSIKYKNSPQSELMSAYYYDITLPLEKNNNNSRSRLTPKLSFRFSPHDMKNHTNTSGRVNVDSAFTKNRLNLGDSFETGESFTLGIDFKQEKVSSIIELSELPNNTDLNEPPPFIKEEVNEIEDFFDFKLATVLRFNKEKYIPIDSTINEKNSSIFGLVKITPNENFILDYNFSLTNDFNILEYNALGLEYISENFSTRFNYIEQAGLQGDASVIGNTTSYKFSEYNTLSFATRRDRRANLTEFYDLVYEFKNDCLKAEIKYRKDYYQDVDIVPLEELFFSVTIIPFYTFVPEKMILNKNRQSRLDEALLEAKGK